MLKVLRSSLRICSTYENVKKEKEFHVSFAVAPQTAKVTTIKLRIQLSGRGLCEAGFHL